MENQCHIIEEVTGSSPVSPTMSVALPGLFRLY
jgi:hypothetical protein